MLRESGGVRMSHVQVGRWGGGCSRRRQRPGGAARHARTRDATTEQPHVPCCLHALLNNSTTSPGRLLDSPAPCVPGTCDCCGRGTPCAHACAALQHPVPLKDSSPCAPLQVFTVASLRERPQWAKRRSMSLHRSLPGPPTARLTACLTAWPRQTHTYSAPPPPPPACPDL